MEEDRDANLASISNYLQFLNSGTQKLFILLFVRIQIVRDISDYFL